MDENQQPKQVCSIRIMFPVDTDDQAIAYKKQISEVLADLPDARVEFTLATVPIPKGQ